MGTLDAPPVTELAVGDTFALSGLVQDKGNICQLALQVLNPLGEADSTPVSQALVLIGTTIHCR